MSDNKQHARVFHITAAQMRDPNYDRTAFREWIAATAGTTYDAECQRVAQVMQAVLANCPPQVASGHEAAESEG